MAQIGCCVFSKIEKYLVQGLKRRRKSVKQAGITDIFSKAWV